jgi:site-specific DNA recombinase
MEGWQIVREFADAAMSGSDGQRPQYRAMVDAANGGEFQVLLIDDLSRLTRDSI